MFGDPNQCNPVESDFSRFFDYMNKKAFRELGDNNLVIKKYIPECCRYDDTLYKVICYLMNNKRLPPPDILKQHLGVEYKMYDPKVIYSVVLKNKTRWMETDRIINGVKKYRHDIKIYDDYFFVNLKVISNINIKGLIYRSRFYYIVQINYKIINKKTITYYELSEEKGGEPIKDNEGKPFQFRNIRNKNHPNSLTERFSCFDPALSITCYKYQGDTIDIPFNIFDIKKMNYNQIFTTISRATKFENLHFKDLYFGTFGIETEPEESTEINMLKMD